MTLIQTVTTDDLVIQVADRLSKTGQVSVR